MVIWGWYRPITKLAIKWEECLRCGAIGVHAIVRQTTWGHIFWIPLLLLWVSHSMICPNCGLTTGLGWRQVRTALKAGRLVLDRPRPHFAAARPQYMDAFGRMPDPHTSFDPITVNPSRSAWDVMIIIWLVGAALLLSLIPLAILINLVR